MRLLALCLLTAACTADSDEPTTSTPVAPGEGDLLIEELYYSGAPPRGGTERYYSDQFIELVNTTDHTLDVSGVSIGEVYGAAGVINPGMEPDSFAASHPDEVVMSSVWRIPRNTSLEPGGHLLIAHDGTNHQPFSTIDLSGADFETWVRDSGGDDDHPTVANMKEVMFNGGWDWLITVFGPSIVVLAADTDLGMESGPFLDLATAPTSAVLDGIDTLMDADSEAFKRLPDSIDAGHAHVSGTYVGESLHRRKANGQWQDTNHSGNDFVAGPPDPGIESTGAEVFGEPTLELGTGTSSWAALTDGDSIELVAGPQGGWHLDVAVRFDGFGPDGVHLAYEAMDEGDAMSFITEAVLSSRSVIEEDAGWLRVGDRVVLDIVSADRVVGLTLTVQVTATVEGQSFQDTRELVVVDNE